MCRQAAHPTNISRPDTSFPAILSFPTAFHLIGAVACRDLSGEAGSGNHALFTGMWANGPLKPVPAAAPTWLRRCRKPRHPADSSTVTSVLPVVQAKKNRFASKYNTDATKSKKERTRSPM